MSEDLVCCGGDLGFTPYAGADPDCELCGGDGAITAEDVFTLHLEQCHWEVCSCVDEARDEPDHVYDDEDADGWLDMVAKVPARYIGSKLDREAITDVVMHSLSKGKHIAGPRYFANPGDKRKVSAHFVVHKDGWTRKLTQCVPLTRVAWHAGNRKMNRCSIGVEHDGPFLEPDQYVTMIDTTVELVRSLQALCPNLETVRSHRSIRPDRRRDPGKYFPFDRFEVLGLAIIP